MLSSLNTVQLFDIFHVYRWDFTGQILPLCGFLYSNGTSLTFVTEDTREVITKPVDTTYASHVSFYLLFGNHNLLVSAYVCLDQH